jgi:hypothetical protein
MPVMDGLTLTEAVKKDAANRRGDCRNAHLGRSPGDADRCRELGVAAYSSQTGPALGTRSTILWR